MKPDSKNKPCKHNPVKLGYLAHQEWAEKKIKHGAKQTQCPKCGLWLFKCEK